jgi:glycosyltransferase involved in cell wall biosynthesis
VLASARSAVLKDHCLRSNAGLWYEDADEFALALDMLVRDERLARVLGENGRRYVAEDYGWDAVLRRYRGLIDAVAKAPARPGGNAG